MNGKSKSILLIFMLSVQVVNIYSINIIDFTEISMLEPYGQEYDCDPASIFDEIKMRDDEDSLTDSSEVATWPTWAENVGSLMANYAWGRYVLLKLKYLCDTFSS
ncbi:MAG TPA: hypothetical protein VHA52_12925 [Candidatus Babeliaceae bacterium]|nr:hypothetical protein [Candidatus Babeliaceae bacterium]